MVGTSITDLDLSTVVLGIAKMAISPLALAEIAATSKAGELPPPNS